MPARPVSVLLPAELRQRLSRQAQQRALKLSTTIKVLLDERMKQLDAEEELSRAEEWQRAQAWGTWDRYRAGKDHGAEWDEITGMFDVALGRKQAGAR